MFQHFVSFQILFQHNDVGSSCMIISTCYILISSHAFRHPERAYSLISAMKLILNCKIYPCVCFCYTWSLVALLNYWGTCCESCFSLRPVLWSFLFPLDIKSSKVFQTTDVSLLFPFRHLFLKWDSQGLCPI